mgnify:CR=1 FL=1
MKRCKKLFNPPVRDSVPNRVGISSKRDDSLVAHFRKMLRQRGLANADCIDEGTHGRFAVFDQLAKNHQPTLIRERAENARHFHGAFLKVREIQHSRHFVTCIALVIANLVCYDINSRGLVQMPVRILYSRHGRWPKQALNAR